MTEGVLYLIQGRKHWSVLCASLLSLRDHWHGNVCVMYADDAGQEIAEKLIEDGRLGITIRPLQKAKSNSRNSGYANKPKLLNASPFNRTIFLDADTIVRGDITPMFPEPGTMRVTQFCEWNTTGKIMRGRLEKWSGVAPAEAAESARESYRAINTGVFGFDSLCSDIGGAWEEMTNRNISFMCDEIACQLLLPGWVNRILVMDDRFNCSPIYSQEQERAVVFHFHGKKHVKNERTREIWLPHYQRCLRMDLAQIKSWSPGADRRLAEFRDLNPQRFLS